MFDLYERCMRLLFHIEEKNKVKDVILRQCIYICINDLGIPNEWSTRSSPPESESRSSSLPISLVDRIVAVVLSETLDRFDPAKIQVSLFKSCKKNRKIATTPVFTNRDYWRIIEESEAYIYLSGVLFRRKVKQGTEQPREHASSFVAFVYVHTSVKNAWKNPPRVRVQVSDRSLKSLTVRLLAGGEREIDRPEKYM